MHHKISAWLLSAGALALAGVALPHTDPTAPSEVAARVSEASSSTTPDAELGVLGDPAALVPKPAPADTPALGEARLDPATGRYVAPLGGGRAVLTLDPRLQERLERALQSYAVPWGATVLLEPSTGRVLAMAEHSRLEPGRRGLAVSALAPAASIFKLVTAAALLERGVPAEEEVCYHGGKRRLSPKLLADDPRRDRRCTSLTDAFGHSTNVVFAKLADRGLDPELLAETAGRFLFNDDIPFVRPVERSTAHIPADPFGLANTAAGFGEVKLSPLHGAVLAAIVANGGVFVPPVLVERAEGAHPYTPGAPRRVVDAAVAAQLAEMMRNTVSEGTARRAFRRTSPAMRGVAVAGKTGSLADASPYRDYSWFVGYAPADNPEVAVATVVVNERLWRVRAPTLAKDALEAYFRTRLAEREDAARVRTASR